MHHRLLESADEVHDILHLGFHVGAQGPVASAEDPPEKIHGAVQLHQDVITNIPDVGQPTHVLHDRVELMAVGNEETATVDRGMESARLDMNVRVVTREIGDPLIMVPGDIDDLRALAALAEDFLDHIAVLLCPEDAALHGPDIDQVADDIEGVAFKRSQESKEGRRLTAARAKMDIRDPDAPVVDGGFVVHRK